MALMRAVVYARTGGSEVLEVVDRPVPEPGHGEVLVRVALSGVNPTDWKRRSDGEPPAEGWQIPNQDGAGVIEAVGPGVDVGRVGERVWLWAVAHGRPWGTAAEYTVVPAHQAVLLGDASFEVGASLGVPFLTAHRCLTLGEVMPDRLGPGALEGRSILVQGGAGAVGNAAIQLARWADATQVIATVSRPEKAQLAAAAGATHVIDYRQQDVVREVRKIAPGGVDAIVEVAPAVNAEIDTRVLAPDGVVAIYATDGGTHLNLPIRPMMVLNAQWHFMLLYTVSKRVREHAVRDVSDAAAEGALRVGPDAGLPLYYFPLESVAEAHDAVRGGAVGKVLITTAS
jgi:NADPH:quinone reductase